MKQRWLSLWVMLLLMTSSQTLAQELTQKKLEKLQSTVMNSNLPLQKRIRALTKIHADQLENGKIRRSFCVWDPLGQNGPIYATVDDQKLRSLHYGLALDVRAYQDESRLLSDLKSGECQAALMRGNRTHEFNRFVATLDAPGAVPDVEHFRTLSQAMASPKMAQRMEQGDYVVAGIAYLGDSYFVRQSRSRAGFSELQQQRLATVDHEPALKAIVKAINPNSLVLSANEMAQRFVKGELDAILVPAVIYHAFIAGQLNTQVQIMNMPQSLSTIQLIARRDAFPTSLAQILREDFLFKFDFYVKRVKDEERNVLADYWQQIPNTEQKRRAKQLQQLRLTLRDEGLYDPTMLRIMRKVRCKLDPTNSECIDVVE